MAKRKEAEQERENYRAAFIVSAIYNTVRNTKKKKTPFKPEDFMGKKTKQRRQTPEEMLEAVKMLQMVYSVPKIAKK